MADHKKMIEDLVREYINQLNDSSVRELIAGKEPDADKKAAIADKKENPGEPKAIVMTLENICRDLEFAEYMRALRAQMQVDFVYDIENPVTCRKWNGCLDEVRQMDIYAPDIELLEQLVKLGGSCHPAVKLLIKALLLGKQVRIVLPRRIENRNLVQKTYHKLLAEAKALGCGICYLNQPEAKSKEIAVPSVLLEEDVKNALREGSGEITVSARCIITPLANDIICENNIRIIRLCPE